MSDPTPEQMREAVEAIVLADYGGTAEDARLGLGVDGLSYERKAARRALDALLALGWRAPVREGGEIEDPIVAAIEASWGERCPDYNEDCCICQAWAQYDEMKYAQDEHLEQSCSPHPWG